MERYFRNGDKSKSEFLRKMKQEKAILYQKQRERKAAEKIAAMLRRNLQYNRFVKPFFYNSLEKVQLILYKRRETPAEKYYKMISNALYKMPFILQTLIFVNDRSLRTHRYFVRALTEAVVGEGHRNDPIKKTLDNKGFPYFEICKLVRFALALLETDPIYEQLVVQFIAETARREPDEISKFLQRQQTRTLLRYHFLFERFLLPNRELILKYVILPNEQLLASIPLPQLIEALLGIPITKTELYHHIDRLLFAGGVIGVDLSFLEKSKKLQEQFGNICNWLRSDINEQCDYVRGIAVSLYIHNRVLRAYEQSLVTRISESYLPRKLINQLDREDTNDLIDRVRKSTEYGKFLSTIDLGLYFGRLLKVFKQQLKLSTLKMLLGGSSDQHLTIKLFSELYLLLGGIFRNMHSGAFEELNDRSFLMFLMGWFAKENLTKLEFYNPKNESVVRLLEILISFMLQRVASMDDVEFVSKDKGFSVEELECMVGMLNSLTLELVQQNSYGSNSNTALQENTVRLLNDLYHKNFRTKLHNPKLFEMPKLNEELLTLTFDKGTHLERLLKAVPFALYFENRLMKLRACINEDKLNYDRYLYQDEDHDDYMTVYIRRGHEFNDAFHRCYTLELRNKYIIVFTNQGVPYPGIDGGGIIKEFLNRVIKTAFDPLYGLFRETLLREIIPSPRDTLTNDLSKYYEFIGMIVGKAIYENILIEAKFSGPFLNLIVGRSNGLEDLRSLDPYLYRSLMSLKHSTEDISHLYLTFSFLEAGRVIELKENGRNIPVTNNNKIEFIMAYSDFKTTRQLEVQSRMFRKGLTRVLNRAWLEMFNHDELNLMISGKEADFDVEDLRKHTVYNGYTEKDTTVMHFWELVRSMTSEQKSLLLLFVTSCSRPPTLGFSELKPNFCIAKSEELGFLPTAHTCMNILRLPNYKNRQTLRYKLQYAITAKAGFEFV